MTILHVSTATSWRGGEQQLAYLAKGLHTLAVNQLVLCPVGSPLSSHLMKESISVTTFSSRGLLDIRLARKLSQLCKTLPISIIHCHDSHAHSAAVVAAFHYGNKVPVVVSRRVDFPVSNNILSRWKYNHPNIQRIICVSETIKHITAPFIRDPHKLTVVHSGIDLTKYKDPTPKRILHAELDLLPSAKIIGNLSALADHKDYPTFIRTAKKVISSDPTIHFIIAGRGKEEQKIRKMIRQLNLDANVHLLGFRTDIEDVMQSLDIFLITSVTEGLGTIVLEAFAAGIPVVATRAGGIPEMVEHDVTGLLADPGDADALAEAVLRLLDHPALGKQMVQNAFNRLNHFSFERTARKTLAIYKEIPGEIKL